jgi:putative transposase
MDERHLMAAARYVPMNPVKALMVTRAADWPWSSAVAHLMGRDDGVVTVRPLLDRIEDLPAFLEAAEDDEALRLCRDRTPRAGPSEATSGSGSWR